MSPRLVALSGPLEGRSFGLGDPPMTLGRHASNQVRIRQISVSRRHCVLEREDGRYLVRDLGSSHGTFVNDRAVRQRRLAHGDLITVGESLFLFLLRAAEEDREQILPEELRAVGLDEASTARLQPGEAPLERIGEHELEHDLVGESAAMQRLFGLIARIAPTDSTVLLSGESGCGKELVARALRANSPRATKPFVAINCATLSETLLESELFGHEKGAFTGAVARKPGKFELAEKGTLFLDEVGEIPLELQAKLLRAIQEREIERLGGRRPIAVDVRLIAATNRDLKAEIARRRFRQDLYYRLDVLLLSLPPLRERREDIPLLARHFLRLHSRSLKRSLPALVPEASEALLAYSWPGNVRELSNAIERAVVLAEDGFIRPEDLPEALFETEAQSTVPTCYHEALNKLKRRLIRDAVTEARGNVTRAAERLGLSPNYLHRLIRNLGLRPELDQE